KQIVILCPSYRKIEQWFRLFPSEQMRFDFIKRSFHPADTKNGCTHGRGSGVREGGGGPEGSATLPICFSKSSTTVSAKAAADSAAYTRQASLIPWLLVAEAASTVFTAPGFFSW